MTPRVEDLHQFVAFDAHADKMQLHFRRRQHLVRIHQQVVAFRADPFVQRQLLADHLLEIHPHRL